MTPREADAALFGEALACEDVRPCGFEAATPDASTLHAEALRAEAFLQALAIVEDSRGEDPEEHGPGALVLQRIEARLDLLTALVGSLLHGTDRDPPRALRWSATGACVAGCPRQTRRAASRPSRATTALMREASLRAREKGAAGTRGVAC